MNNNTLNRNFLKNIKTENKHLNRLALKGEMYDKVVRVNTSEASPTNSVVSSMNSASSYEQRKKARSATQKAENALQELKAFTNMLVVT